MGSTIKDSLFKIKIIKLFFYNFKLFKYKLKKPKFGTFWYCVKESRFYFKLRILIYIISVILIFILFIFARFLREYQSLVFFIYLIWFFCSLFYIEFIRV